MKTLLIRTSLVLYAWLFLYILPVIQGNAINELNLHRSAQKYRYDEKRKQIGPFKEHLGSKFEEFKKNGKKYYRPDQFAVVRSRNEEKTFLEQRSNRSKVELFGDSDAYASPEVFEGGNPDEPGNEGDKDDDVDGDKDGDGDGDGDGNGSGDGDEKTPPPTEEEAPTNDGGLATNLSCSESFNTRIKSSLCMGIPVGTQLTNGWRACRNACQLAYLCNAYSYREMDRKCYFWAENACLQSNEGWVSGDGVAPIHDCTSCHLSPWNDWIYPCVKKSAVPNLEPPTSDDTLVKYRTREIFGYHYNNQPLTGDKCYTVKTAPCDGAGPQPDDSSSIIMIAGIILGTCMLLALAYYGYKSFSAPKQSAHPQQQGGYAQMSSPGGPGGYGQPYGGYR